MQIMGSAWQDSVGGTILPFRSLIAGAAFVFPMALHQGDLVHE
jgi:hypothetical protein